MRNMKVLYTFAFLSLLAFGLLAQGQPTGEVEDVQVIIEKDKPLVLPNAARIYERTEIRKIQEDTVSLSYGAVSQPVYSFENYKPSFRPKAFTSPNENKGYKNHVKAGFGNYQSPLLEGYFALEERVNYLGLYLKHESFGKGPVRGASSAFSENQFNLDGRYVARYFEFKPILNYRREGFYYYGYDEASYQLTLPGSDVYFQERTLFNSWNAGGSISSSDKNDLIVSFTPKYQGVSMRTKGKQTFNTDNIIDLESKVGYEISKFSSFTVMLGYKWAQYDGGHGSFNRSRTLLNPKFQYEKEKIYINAGLKLVSGKDSSSQFYFYPDVSAKYFLNEKYSIAAKIDGDLELNTLESLYNINNYLEDSLAIINTNRPISISGIFAAKLNERLILEGSLGYDVIKNQPLFNFSTSDTSRFVTRYDENFGRFSFGAKASYYIENQTFIILDFHYYAYKEGTQAEAWFLPLRKLQLSAQHEFIEGLRAKTMFSIVGGIKAPNVNINSDPIISSDYQVLDPIIDVGLDLSYDVKDNIGLFVNVDNILNQHYERYLNYPSRGIAAKFGFIFHF